MVVHQWSRQHFLHRTCVVSVLMFQNGEAWNAGVTTTPTIGQLFQTCSMASLKATNASTGTGSPLDIVGDEQQFASDAPHSLSIMSLDEAIKNRYSCKKFRRYRQENSAVTTNDVAVVQQPPSASESNPSVVQRAIESLNLARRTPTAFNTQPYKVVLVSSPEQKMALSQYCLGPNRQKVQDADCTVIFLADKQIMRTFPSFRKFIRNIGIMKKYRPLTTKAMLTMQFYITIFSSGYPLPRLLSSTLSFAVRACMAWMHFVLKWFNYPLPTLSNAETWSTRQAMMVAMTYMLACTARGLATCPMEGQFTAFLTYFFNFYHIANKIYTRTMLE